MINVYEYLFLTFISSVGVMLAIWMSSASFFFVKAKQIHVLNGDIPSIRIAKMVNTSALFFLVFFILVSLVMFTMQISTTIPIAIILTLVCKWRYNAYTMKLYNLKYSKRLLAFFMAIDAAFFVALVAILPIYSDINIV